MVLALLGSLGLLLRRLFNVNYSEYTKGSDYFNLSFFVVTLVIAVVAHATADPSFAGLRIFFGQLVTFNLAPEGGGAPAILAAEIILGSILVAYIPLTHMSHFFTKWFMYHDVRWNDTPIPSRARS